MPSDVIFRLVNGDVAEVPIRIEDNGDGTYTLTGTAGFSIKGVDGANGEKDQGLSVTFGHGNDPGLIVENGALKKLDVTVIA